MENGTGIASRHSRWCCSIFKEGGTINFDNLQEKQNPQKKRLSVAYNGKILKPDMTLKKCGLTNKSVVQILVRLQG